MAATVAGMDSRDLTKDQCRWINDRLSAMAGELCRLKARLEERQFPANDKLRIKVEDAYDAVLTASHHAHSLSCQGQRGRTYFFVNENGDGEPKAS